MPPQRQHGSARRGAARPQRAGQDAQVRRHRAASRCSDDQNLLAYTVDFTGFRQYALQVKDLRTGATLPDTTERVDQRAWAADNQTLFLTTEDAVTKRSDKLWRHVLGTTDVRAALRGKGRALRHRGSARRATSSICCCRSKPRTPPSALPARRTIHGLISPCFCRARRSTAITWTTARACSTSAPTSDGGNFAIMTAPENDPAPKNWKVFVPHRDRRARCRASTCSATSPFRRESREALNHLRIHNFKHRGVDRDHRSPSRSMRPFRAARRITTSSTYRYNYQSFVTPPSVFDYDMRSRHSTLLKQQEVLGGYDPGAVCQRAPVGHGAGRHAGADLDRLQEGPCARRQRRRCSSTATGPTDSARRRRFRARGSACSIAAWPMPSRTSAAATKWASSGARTACS